MKKRKRSVLRKARQAILNTADEFQKSGIDCTHRMIFVGGTRPKSVHKTREEQEKRRNREDNKSER